MQVWIALFVGGFFSAAAIHDADSTQILNRLYECLLVRQAADGTEVGADAPDPYLWYETKHLLSGDSHRRALRCLDEFLDTHTERGISDPLVRATLQHDLWAVFDWAAIDRGKRSAQESELMSRLARVMKRIALTPEQIRSLPDTYAEAAATGQPGDLPRDLFVAGGPWVCLSGHRSEPTALTHFSGRSRFLIFMRSPGGRDQTLAYIRKLSVSGPPTIRHGNVDLLNLKLPQFPAGTAVALVRQMLVIDSNGNLAPTPVTETVQLRVYQKVTPGTAYMNFHAGPSAHDQSFYEFRFARRNRELIAVRPEDREYSVVFSQGFDPYESTRNLEPPRILDTCRSCHADSGIHSVQSRLRWIGHASDFSLGGVIRWETGKTVDLKRRTREFRMLQQYWRDAE